MGLFDFLKNKKKSVADDQADDQLQIDVERFEKEVLKTIPRYISKPGAEVNVKARHLETNEEMQFAYAFPEQFNPWRTVKSLADRRGIIYSLLDSQLGNQLALWQVLERFNDDRCAEKALAVAHQHKNEVDEQDPDFWNALARTHFILTEYGEAERNCLRALDLDNSNIRTKRIYADILHCTNRHQQAHELYEEIQRERLPADKAVSLSIQELLGFDGDITNSPIYALAWLKNDRDMPEEVWEWANEEFYYSPHFRSQYAYHLIEKKEHLRGFVKLLNITKEMPWFKEAVVNCYNMIDQLNLQDKMQEEKIRLEKIM